MKDTILKTNDLTKTYYRSAGVKGINMALKKG